MPEEGGDIGEVAGRVNWGFGVVGLGVELTSPVVAC